MYDPLAEAFLQISEQIRIPTKFSVSMAESYAEQIRTGMWNVSALPPISFVAGDPSSSAKPSSSGNGHTPSCPPGSLL